MRLTDEVRELIKSQINETLQDTGFTPAEEESRAQEEAFTEQQELFRLAQEGKLGVDEVWDASWQEGQERDLRTNFLYGEYLNHRLTSRDPLSFEEYTKWVGIKAIFRLLSRVKNGNRMARAMNPDLQIQELQNFMTLGKHREKDPRLLLKSFFTEVTGGWEMVNNLLLKYAHKVEDVWDTKRMHLDRTPLPGERDWYFDEDSPLDKAVEDYLGGATINHAAKANKVSNRRLSRELTRLGVERVQRKGNK